MQRLSMLERSGEEIALTSKKKRRECICPQSPEKYNLVHLVITICEFREKRGSSTSHLFTLMTSYRNSRKLIIHIHV